MALVESTVVDVALEYHLNTGLVTLEADAVNEAVEPEQIVTSLAVIIEPVD